MTEILYFDSEIAVAVKPAGAVSEGNISESGTFPAMIFAELLERGAQVTNVYPVHRLDRETSGVMVYALTERSAAALSRDVAERRISKKYEALVHGRPDGDCGEFTDLLYHDRQKNKSFAVKKERRGVKDARLEYEVLSYDGEKDLSRVSVTLHTGRTHQIRVQFASRKMPLFGDRKYGAPKEDGNALALSSVYLAFSHPKTKKHMEFLRDAEF